MSDAAEALKRWAWAFHNGDYTNAPQAVADLRGAARYIAELEEKVERYERWFCKNRNVVGDVTAGMVDRPPITGASR